MPLIDQVKIICDRLAPLGWRELLMTVTGNSLDITKPTADALRIELTKSLATIDRSFSGFEDFAAAGKQAITASQPSLSLLYHALASPLVTRDQHGAPLAGFATVAELDTLENFVFSLGQVSLPQLIKKNGGAAQVAIVVFSSDYRNAADTVDGRHADLTFSRTGIARVGTASPRYLPVARSFWPEDEDNPHNIRVLPARFSAWLAVKRKGSDTRVSPILDNLQAQAADEGSRDFWVPVHKLFPGSECLKGKNLSVAFQSSLFNLKIQRVHRFLGTTPLPDEFPYVIRDAEIASLSGDTELGPGWLVPKVRVNLVDPAIVNGKPLTFTVTPANVDDFAAFEGNPQQPVLGLPSYVHARTRVSGGALEDINDQLDVIAAMKAGASYQALHYIDYTGDGWVLAEVPELNQTNLRSVAAYALVSAPDFFPSSGQFELSEWSRSQQVPNQFRDSLWHEPPTPLSETRMPANLQLPNSPFESADSTVTAVVGMGGPNGLPSLWPVQPHAQRTTSLPDDAAGLFAPGWDVSVDTSSSGNQHLAAYGLGSPFPEDAKLCAALSTFWPAVAPDVFRTFVHLEHANANGTIAPLTDEEIGQSGTLPLDGITGPKVVTINGQSLVEFPSFLNADYVRQAVENRFSIRLTSRISAEEYQRRILAASRVFSVLANLGDIIAARNTWLMLSFREVSSGDSELQSAQSEAGVVLEGKVYGGRVCRMAPLVKPKTDPHLDRMPLVDDRQFFVSASALQVLTKRSTDPRFGSSLSER
jgi:hypothetical protein